MAEVTGIDHVYIGVTSLAVSEPFYDRVWRDALGLPKFEFLAQSFSRAACRETVSARCGRRVVQAIQLEGADGS